MIDRRRLLVVVGVLAVLVVLFVGGVGGGALRDDRDPAVLDARQRLERFDPAALVEPSVISTSDGCAVDVPARLVQIVGDVCVLRVPEAGGLPWRGASRTLRVAVVGAPLRLRTVVEGRTVEGAVPAEGAPDEPVEVGFGRAAVEVELQCVPGPPCTVSLPD